MRQYFYFILLFLFFFESASSQNKFYDTIRNVLNNNQQILEIDLTGTQIDNFDIANSVQHFIFDDKAYVLLYKANKFSIYSPFDVDSSGRLDSLNFSFCFYFIDHEQKRCIYFRSIDYIMLKRVQNDHYILDTKNQYQFFTLNDLYELDINNHYKPIIKLKFTLLTTVSFLNKDFQPNKNSQSGDIWSIVIYNYYNNKCITKTFYSSGINDATSNIYTISYNDLLNLYPIYLEKSENCPKDKILEIKIDNDNPIINVP